MLGALARTASLLNVSTPLEISTIAFFALDRIHPVDGFRQGIEQIHFAEPRESHRAQGREGQLFVPRKILSISVFKSYITTATQSSGRSELTNS